MAKNYFDRYIWLIDLIDRHGYIKFEDISHAWAFSSQNHGDSASIQQSELPPRTFFNHIAAISDIFGIEIKCDREKGYYIANNEDWEGDGARKWLLRALSMKNLLNEADGMKDRILFEEIPSSHKWVPEVVKAMREGTVIEMTYKSFWREEANTYLAKPYCLKLFKQRWYMLAKSEGKKELRVYALDERMIDIKFTGQRYTLPPNFCAKQYFSNHFGIIGGNDWAPQDIKIKVVNDQVKYFDTLPLHGSQKKIMAESNEAYTVYQFHLAPTFDFKQELLSRGPAVEVLCPKSFRQEVMDDVAVMAKQYGLA